MSTKSLKQSEEHRDQLASNMAKNIQRKARDELKSIDNLMQEVSRDPKLHLQRIEYNLYQAKKRLESSLSFLTEAQDSFNILEKNIEIKK